MRKISGGMVLILGSLALWAGILASLRGVSAAWFAGLVPSW